MGGGCYRGSEREMFEVGSWCDNACFQEFGGCEGSMSGTLTKPMVNCEYRPSEDERLPIDMDRVNEAIDSAIRRGKELFLYTPDMFQPYYLEGCLSRLPKRNGKVYLAINACVRSFIESGISYADLHALGIREVWFGIESADPGLRDQYGKPPFGNEEAVRVTTAGRKAGINVCWFLVDGAVDDDASRLATYQLIRDAEPFRIQVGRLERHLEREAVPA